MTTEVQERRERELRERAEGHRHVGHKDGTGCYYVSPDGCGEHHVCRVENGCGITLGCRKPASAPDTDLLAVLDELVVLRTRCLTIESTLGSFALSVASAAEVHEVVTGEELVQQIAQQHAEREELLVFAKQVLEIAARSDGSREDILEAAAELSFIRTTM